MFERLRRLFLAGNLTESQIRAAADRQPVPWITHEQADAIIAEAAALQAQ